MTVALKLQLIITLMHLSKDHGFTYKAIENDGFKIDKKVESLDFPNTPLGVINSTAKGMQGIAFALTKLKPDIVLIIGDRFEILSAAYSAAMFSNSNCTL